MIAELIDEARQRTRDSARFSLRSTELHFELNGNMLFIHEHSPTGDGQRHGVHQIWFEARISGPCDCGGRDAIHQVDYVVWATHMEHLAQLDREAGGSEFESGLRMAPDALSVLDGNW